MMHDAGAATQLSPDLLRKAALIRYQDWIAPTVVIFRCPIRHADAENCPACPTKGSLCIRLLTRVLMGISKNRSSGGAYVFIVFSIAYVVEDHGDSLSPRTPRIFRRGLIDYAVPFLACEVGLACTTANLRGFLHGSPATMNK